MWLARYECQQWWQCVVVLQPNMLLFWWGHHNDTNITLSDPLSHETSNKYSSKRQRKWPSKHPSPWPSALGLTSAPNTANPASTSPPTSPPAIANMAAASLATPVPVNYKGVLFPAFDDTNIVSAVVAFWTNVQVCGSNVFVVAFGRVFLLLLLLRSLLFLF